jgi:hypothetical protein
MSARLDQADDTMGKIDEQALDQRLLGNGLECRIAVDPI